MQKLIGITLCCSLIALSGCNRTSTYDECIIESMKGVSSDSAARAVKLSCRTKYPEKHPDDMELTAATLAKITGHAGVNEYGNFTGNIYNGSNEWSVTQVTVSLSKTTNKPWLRYDFDKDGNSIPPPAGYIPIAESKAYRIDVIAQPLTSKDFSIPVDNDRSSQVEWNIVNARGYKAH